ncbi:hypothetical protein BFW38_15940 [Terasakiispira papahanaumokuakeensis]|uniref:HTH gntR-type domain-containing protein n=1 Tax=Terasakiispira papahanaumokuakeensis TaxID=197479 RepID=A0A1E2VCQ8_9GAMM|nr:PLP-dependent aminotransferase family protein [Terasakiispira papahanaumokuakeensis]ODC04800.1 hypothetical protein BFW38_15940 [Terasakiispira papahanaumokuakeensis]
MPQVKDQGHYRYRQLAKQIRDDIQQGRWQPGDQIPSVRHLMASHQVSRATVLHALQLLEQEALVLARPRRGYFVNSPVPEFHPSASPPVVAPRLFDIDDVVQDVMRHGAVFDLYPQAAMPEGGDKWVPDTLQRALGRALRQQKERIHAYYDEPEGHYELRDVIAQRLRYQGCQTVADDVVMTQGCQHALLLALQSCTQAGDTVAVESPGYFGTLQLLQALGLRVIELPCHADTGLDMDALADALQHWPIKALVISPSYATPLGSCVPLSARYRLAELARRHEMMIVEDHIYMELGWSDEPRPPMLSLVPERVILCSSFSKSLSRALRLGWVIGPSVHSHLLHLKHITVLSGNRFIEQGMADFIQSGEYDRHLRRFTHQLHLQKNALLRLLHQHYPETQFSHPQGGLCLWWRLERNVDTLSLYHQARQHGIVITPGIMFTTQALYHQCLRLSFAHPWTLERRRALLQLKQWM